MVAAAVENLPDYTFDEFVALQGAAPEGVRYEWVGGRVYLMSGGTERHDLLTGFLYQRLAAWALAKGCRPFQQNRLVRTSLAAYFPDVLVVCGPAADPLHEADARIVVEVASRSTRDIDRREKATAYATLPGLAAYVLADPSEPLVEVGTRRPDGTLTWRRHGSGHLVLVDDLAVDVDALYDTLDSTATT